MSVKIRTLRETTRNPCDGFPAGHELFGRTRLTAVIQEYLTNAATFRRYIQSINPLSTRTIHLDDPNMLRTYVENEQHMRVAMKVVKANLGREPRLIVNRAMRIEEGHSLSLNPEIIARAMNLVRGKIGLEIGGAEGENALLLALAGAERIYMNDRANEEVASFSLSCEGMPSEIQAKLEAIEGDCLELLEKKPELRGRVSVVLCRNLIQFFPDAAMQTFFDQLRQLLEPGGRAIITTNGVYPFPNQQMFQSCPKVTTYTKLTCILEEEGKLPTELFSNYCPSYKSPDSFASKEKFICTSTSNARWQFDKQAYNTFTPVIRMALQKICEDNRAKIERVKAGGVKALEATGRFFTKKNLAKLAIDHGFLVESTFVMSHEGHLVEEKNLYTQGERVGVIIQAPSNP